jgi:hypothetical protein
MRERIIQLQKDTGRLSHSHSVTKHAHTCTHLIAQLEEHPLLWVHHACFALGEAERRGIAVHGIREEGPKASRCIRRELVLDIPPVSEDQRAVWEVRSRDKD